MASRGKNLTVFLIDGEATGRIKVTAQTSIILVYKIPRKLLNECRDYEAFGQSGVYFLFGENRVYVGQAEVRQNGGALYNRVLEHTSDKLKNLWDEVVIITSKDKSLGLTDIAFLEHLFHSKAASAKRYTLLNVSTPTRGTITEEKRCELEEIADSAELFMGVLGYRLFEPLDTSTSTPSTTPTEIPVEPPTNNPSYIVPPLPDSRLKIGSYVYSAMRNLEACGFVFSSAEISSMCTPEWALSHFHTGKPFLKKYFPGETDSKGPDGQTRFRAKPFQFGESLVLISKEWFERQRPLFDNWYNSLSQEQQVEEADTKSENAPLAPLTSAFRSNMPNLPEGNLGPCEFVKTALINLLASGYTFSDEQIEAFGSVEGSRAYTKRNMPLFLVLKEGESRASFDKAVQRRYWKDEFLSGNHRFLMFSQWYDDPKKGATKDYFINWYNSL